MATESKPEIPDWTSKYKLTPKQLLFVVYYLDSYNATQAAIKAGYSESTAYAIGSENLNKLEIKKAVNEGSKYVIEETFDHIKAKTLKEINKLSFIDVTEFYDENGDVDFPKLKRESKGAISGIKKTTNTDKDGNVKELIEIKTYSKEKTLDLLSKYTQLANETLNVEHSGGISIKFENATEGDEEPGEDEGKTE